MSHSAQVALALEIRGESFPLASVGPTEMKLRDPSPAWWTIDVGDWAELVSVVDGLETRQEIRVTRIDRHRGELSYGTLHR